MVVCRCIPCSTLHSAAHIFFLLTTLTHRSKSITCTSNVLNDNHTNDNNISFLTQEAELVVLLSMLVFSMLAKILK